MANHIGMDLSELALLDQDLKLLSKVEQRKSIKKGLRKGANLLRDETRRRAPVQTGKLKKNIVSGQRGNMAGVYIRGTNDEGTNSDTTMKADDPKNAFYWRFVEYGTSRSPAKPFIRPAFDSKEVEAEKEVIKGIMEDIDKVLLR